MVDKPKGISSPQKKQIEDICTLLEQARKNHCCLGMLVDEEKLWHVKSQAKQRSFVDSPPNISLEELLRTSTKLSLREKRILAVVLANSLLQLCESPWFSKDWSKEDISFFYKSANQVDLKNPYISAFFQNAQKDADPEAMLRIHPNQSILALGILLLEIQLGKPIESQRTAEDLVDGQNVNVNTDLTTALRLFEDSVDDIYEDYRTAIQACLNCNFVSPDQALDLENADFRQAVYENIVAPLEQELYHGFKLTAKDLK